MLLLLVLSMSITNALSQVIFYKQINIGWLADFWQGSQEKTLFSTLENTVEGCWRNTSLKSKRLEVGGGVTSKNLLTFELEAFPIPAKGNIPIRIPRLEANSRVLIMSLEGQVLYEEQLFSLETFIDINQLDFGYYIVKYESNNYSWQLPLIKHC